MGKLQTHESIIRQTLRHIAILIEETKSRMTASNAALVIFRDPWDLLAHEHELRVQVTGLRRFLSKSTHTRVFLKHCITQLLGVTMPNDEDFTLINEFGMGLASDNLGIRTALVNAMQYAQYLMFAADHLELVVHKGLVTGHGLGIFCAAASSSSTSKEALVCNGIRGVLATYCAMDYLDTYNDSVHVHVYGEGAVEAVIKELETQSVEMQLVAHVSHAHVVLWGLRVAARALQQALRRSLGRTNIVNIPKAYKRGATQPRTFFFSCHAVPLCLSANGKGEVHTQGVDQNKLVEHAVQSPISLKPVFAYLNEPPTTVLVGDIRPNMERCVVLGARLLIATSPNDLVPSNKHYSRVSGFGANEIAVIGYSCRVPGANNADELWELVCNKRDMHEQIPLRLFALEDYYSPRHPEDFDAAFFGFNQEQAEQMDPQHRIGLLTAYEALEHANLCPGQEPNAWTQNCGVFVGGAGDDYRENCSNHIQEGFIRGNTRQFLTANISNFFGLRGPSHTYDTACSSSLVALEAACNNLLSGRCDMAISGGVSVIVQPQIFIGLDRGYFLSKTGQCKTFDNAGDGYCRADAVGMVILKRLSDAERDGNYIHGVLSAVGTNHSGKSHSIVAPHAPAQRHLLIANCNSARILPADVNVVELHGTGTQGGDASEMESVRYFFEQKSAKRQSPLALGSVKANIGHSEAASGVIAMIKSLLMIKHQTVAPHVLKGVLNKHFPPQVSYGTNLDTLAAIYDAPTTCKISYLVVNNFSAAGGNSSVVLRHHKQKDDLNLFCDHPTDPQFIFVCANTAKALRSRLRDLHHALENSTCEFPVFACKVNTCLPTHMPFRTVLEASSLDECKALLQRLPEIRECKTRRAQFLGFLFTGQGAQYVKMGLVLSKRFPKFNDTLRLCDHILLELGFEPVCSMVHANNGNEICTPYHWQVGIVVIEIALLHLLQAMLLEPNIVAGHSLGEYTALYSAGVLTLRDTLLLTSLRARLICSLCKPNATCMLAARTSSDKICELVDANKPRFDPCEIACINSPTDTVVAGPRTCIQDLSALLVDLGIKSSLVNLPYAFHSSAIDPVCSPLENLIHAVKFRPPERAVLSNVFGRIIQPGETNVFNAKYIVRHMRNTVLFSNSLCDGFGAFKNIDWVEVGPHPYCSSMLRSCAAAMNVKIDDAIPCMRRKSDEVKTFLGLVRELYLRGQTLSFNALYSIQVCNAAKSLELCLYPFDYTKYWVRYKDRNLSFRTTMRSQSPPSFPGTSCLNLIEGDPRYSEHTVFKASRGFDLLPRLPINGEIIPSASQLCAVATCAVESCATLRREHVGPTWALNLVRTWHRPVACDMMLTFLRLSHSGMQNAWTCDFYNTEESVSDPDAVCRITTDAKQIDWSLAQTLVQIRSSAIMQGETNQPSRNLLEILLTERKGRVPKSRAILNRVYFANDGREAVAQLQEDTCVTRNSCIEFSLEACVQMALVVAGIAIEGSELTLGRDPIVSFEGLQLNITSRPFQVFCSDVAKHAGAQSCTFHMFLLDARNNVMGEINTLTLTAQKNNGRPAICPFGRFAAPEPTFISGMIPESSVSSEQDRHGRDKPSYSDPPSGAVPILREIILQELGMAEGELYDNVVLADYGLDSLMALMIIGAFKERIPSSDLPGSFFLDYPTWSDVKNALQGHVTV